MIDSLCDQARGQDVAVACVYFDFAAQKEQSSTRMLGSLLKQLVVGQGGVPEEIVQAYEAQKNFIGGRGPQNSNIIKMLQTTSSKKRTFICIDAVDECVPEHRVKLLDSLNKILQESPGTRIFVTGRPHIGPEIERRLAGRVTSLPICTKRDDVIRYLRSRLEEDTTPDAMNSCLEAEILEKVPESVSEMYVETTQAKPSQASIDKYLFSFLLVSLNIDAVLQETTIHRRRQRLRAMTDGLGLGDAYGATLGRIKGQSGEKTRLGMAALMWISHAERPLRADELYHALAVEIGSPDLNIDNIPSINTLLTCCQGLVAVEKEGSKVRLIHFTLQEYLRAHPSLFGSAHSAMAETCLSYLNSQPVQAFSTSPSPDLHATPFLEYSSLYWGVHAEKDLSDRVKVLAQKLFHDCNSHISTKILLEAQKPYCYAIDFDKPSLFSGLHWASFFGIVEIVAGLVGIEDCDINRTDFMGNTPLHWAAGRGREGVVKILLGRDDINLDEPDDYGRTPLWWAAYGGHEGVVEILLEQDHVNPGKLDDCRRTPLWWAAQNGHEEVVKILLGRDNVSPDNPDINNQTPLLCAAYNGHEGVVEILLGRDNVNPDQPDINGRGPLWWAVRNGHEGVVKILLGRDDVNPNQPDKGGRRPLWRAVCYEHVGVVEILLGQYKVNLDNPENDGQTLLGWAAHNGHDGVVKTLLERDDVSPDRQDKCGPTPLSRAAENGYKE